MVTGVITGIRFGFTTITDVADGDSSWVVIVTLSSLVSGKDVGVELSGCLIEDGIPVVLD